MTEKVKAELDRLKKKFGKGDAIFKKVDTKFFVDPDFMVFIVSENLKQIDKVLDLTK